MWGRIIALALFGLAGTSLGQGCSDRSLKTSHTSSAQGGSCSTPSGFSGSPKSIEEAIAMINALPKPVSVACFLQSLKRPLNVNLTNSVTSAQPAFNTRSPRVFILMDAVTISVVPEGVGSEVVEFSVASLPNPTSLKGELAFPVTANLAPTAAYDRIRFGGGTVCQFCHANEGKALDFPQTEAFRSNALQPRPASKVDLESLRAEWMTCDAVSEPKRCEILKGLFDHGTVQPKDFPANYPTLF